MKCTMLQLSILAITICCLTISSSSPAAQSVNGSHAETRAGPWCMACRSGCEKFGVSNVSQLLVQFDLDLNADIEATIRSIEAGDEAEIQAIIDKSGIPFFITGTTSLSQSLVPATQSISTALNNIAGAVNKLADSVDVLVTVLELTLIYAQYKPDRQAIRYQMEKLVVLAHSTPETYCANLRAFMGAYLSTGKDLPLNNLYEETKYILAEVSSVTGEFRRLVTDFGDDIIMHVNAGIATYVMYSIYAGFPANPIIETWNQRLVELQAQIKAEEDRCISKSTQDDLSNYMYKIRDTSGCPYGNHEERCKSTYIAMTDKFDWMAWSYTCYDSPHGPHAYDEDEISGPQYARSGWDENQLRGVYMTKYQRDITDDTLVTNCMSGKKDLNCDQVHEQLRACGAGGSLACAEVQLNVYNYRDGDRGYHGYIGGNDVDVWVTWLDTEPITKATAQDAANIPKMAAPKITEGAKRPNIRAPARGIEDCV